MAHRFHPRCRARSGRSRFGLLRRDQMLMARTSVRSALDTCPNTAQKFATRPGLCFVPRASFEFDGGYAPSSSAERDGAGGSFASQRSSGDSRTAFGNWKLADPTLLLECELAREKARYKSLKAIQKAGEKDWRAREAFLKLSLGMGPRRAETDSQRCCSDRGQDSDRRGSHETDRSSAKRANMFS
jgi:hypothetical protein